MITVKTKEEIKKMRRTGRVLAKLFDALDNFYDRVLRRLKLMHGLRKNWRHRI